METEVFIQSLGWFLLGLIKIDNLPSLVSSVVSVPGNDLSSFLVFSSMDIKAFLVLPVDEVFISIGEDLPPSRVGAPDLHVVGLS
jgi:hypothetical protein